MFAIQNNPKHLDSLCKMNVNVWDSFEGVNPWLIVK